MRISSLIVIVVVALACAHSFPQESGAPPISTVDSSVMPDSLAQRLLVDLHELDSNFILDARYSTPNNFTGAPIPGYGSNRAMLLREAAAAFKIGTPFDTFPQRLTRRTRPASQRQIARGSKRR